ncbi:unnamed protein product [Camellia sinensis]
MIVYLSLCCALIALVLGAYLHIGGLLITFGCLGSIVWLLLTSSYEEQQKRVLLLMAVALFEAASIGPLIELVVEIDPRRSQLQQVEKFKAALSVCQKQTT